MNLTTDLTKPKYMERVEFWDLDEPDTIIVTLHYGWSFEPPGCGHEGVYGFDTVREAKVAIKNSYPCDCEECKFELKKGETKC